MATIQRPIGWSAPATATGRRATAHKRHEWLQAYLYLLPAFALIAVWVYWPAISTFRLSFYQWNLLATTPKVPVGSENYHNVVTLPEMGTALRNTGFYILGLLPFSVILPLTIAFILNELTGRMRGVYRAIIFVPMLMAPVAVGIVWDWIMDPVNGILNRTLGLGQFYWFRHPTTAIGAIIGITGWKFLGFSVLIFTAGLSNISREYMEAASVDGATRWQTVRTITLPLLSPTIIFMITLTVLLSGQWTFPLINVLTQGGPLDATTNIYYLLYDFGFHNFNIGLSAAAAVLFFAGFGVLALLFTWLSDRFSFYDT
jgi:multiple sugar transport system permease protein